MTSSTEASSGGESSGCEDGQDTPLRSGSPVGLGITGKMSVAELNTKGSRWDARRRDSKVNGADLYVARITKTGCGDARPCWRCLEWCRWAGIKRIFHWNKETNTFDVVKVNSALGSMYETHADQRLFAGLVSIESTSYFTYGADYL